MILDYITLAGFVLAIFVAGIAVGKLVEKIERHIEKENGDYRSKYKNNRH